MQQNLKEIFGNSESLDPKSVEFLTQALERNNLPGFDYLEFKMAVRQLKSMNMPEETAFKSAFATATTVGLTKEKLLSSMEHYKQVLTKEKEQFGKALKNQLERRVNSRKQEIEQLKAQIAAWKKEMEELQKKVEASQKAVDESDNRIKEEMDKIQYTKVNFENTHQSILDQVDEDFGNANRYL